MHIEANKQLIATHGPDVSRHNGEMELQEAFSDQNNGGMSIFFGCSPFLKKCKLVLPFRKCVGLSFDIQQTSITHFFCFSFDKCQFK